MPSSVRIPKRRHIFLKALLDSPGWCFTHVQQKDSSEDNKSWWRIQQVPFYTFGSALKSTLPSEAFSSPPPPAAHPSMLADSDSSLPAAAHSNPENAPVPAPRKRFAVQAPPLCPPVPAPRQCLLVPALPECPPVPTPPERQTEPASTSPKDFFFGGGGGGGGSRAPAIEAGAGAVSVALEVVSPWPPESQDSPWPRKSPDSPWPPEFLDPPWPPEFPWRPPASPSWTSLQGAPSPMDTS